MAGKAWQGVTHTPMRFLSLLVLGVSTLAAAPAPAPTLPPGALTSVPLWANGAPGSESKRDVAEVVTGGNITQIHHPSITVFLPPDGQRTGVGVVVMPGGGHRDLVIEKEGYAVARWLAAHGVAGFVLKYRLAKEPNSIYRVEVEELADAQRSIRLIRSRAGEWGVDPAKLGVMGFSAGGELAALASKRYGTGDPKSNDPLDRINSKPAFQALIYPGATGSIAPDVNSPPAFLAAGYNDRPEISQGIARAYLLFQNVGVPAELHIFAGVGHGFGLRAGPAASWPDHFISWLKVGKFEK